MAAIDHPEAVRRQHRQLSLFLMLQCRSRGLGGLILERDAIKRLLGIDKLEEDRLRMLREDLKELFPHQKEISEKKDAPYQLHLCHSEFDPGWRAHRESGGEGAACSARSSEIWDR